MRKNGIALSVTQPVSTKPSQTPAVNGFAIELNSRPTLINFGTLYPDYEGNAAEIQRLKKAGIKGVKFHPDYQSFFVDEERMFPLYRQMADAGLIAFFHAGVDIGLPPPVHCTPDRLAAVLDRVPDLTVVAAHFGGFKMWDDVEKHLIGRNLWLDTSYTLAWFSGGALREHGAQTRYRKNRVWHRFAVGRPGRGNQASRGKRVDRIGARRCLLRQRGGLLGI